MVLTIITVVLFVVFGFGLLAKLAVFLGDLKKGGQPVESNDQTPPIPPRFEPIPKATNQRNFDIKGSTEPGATVKIEFNGEENELLANNVGEFHYTASLDTGGNTITAYSEDSSGNKSVKTEEQSIVFDNTPPTLDVTKPEDGAGFYGTKQRQLVIEGKSEVDTQVSINGRHVLVDGTGAFTFLMTLSEGDNNLAVKSQDIAGNIAEKTLKVTYSP